jgi:hypothetical protein
VYTASNSTSGYQYWVLDPNGSYSRRLFLSHAAPGSGFPAGTPNGEKCSYFKLNAMAAPGAIPAFKLLNIRVRSRVNGVNSEFGPACRMKIDPMTGCQPTQLTTTATPVISCGATNVNVPGGVLWANNVAGANKYQFQFTRPGYTRNISSDTRNLTIGNWQTNPLQCGLTYDVRVRASFDGGSSYCAFGATCQITVTPCPPFSGGSQHVAMTATDASFMIWPNPNRGDALNLSLSGAGKEVVLALVEVSDLSGRVAFTTEVPVTDGAAQELIELKDLSEGTYVVTVLAGEERFVERLVVQ